MAFAVSLISLAVFTAVTVIVFLYPDISAITDDMFLKITDCDYSKVFTEYVKRISNVFR